MLKFILEIHMINKLIMNQLAMLTSNLYYPFVYLMDYITFGIFGNSFYMYLFKELSIIIFYDIPFYLWLLIETNYIGLI